MTKQDEQNIQEFSEEQLRSTYNHFIKKIGEIELEKLNLTTAAYRVATLLQEKHLESELKRQTLKPAASNVAPVLRTTPEPIQAGFELGNK